MRKTFRHLGVFSDWVAAADKSAPLYPVATPGIKTQKLVAQTLAFSPGSEQPRKVRIERRWKKNGIEGEEVSWTVGYGPRTKAWLLRPAGVTTPSPGVLALHDHGGFKYYGIEKIADSSRKTPPDILKHRERGYGGRAFANDLAREGFAVLVSDVFLWGSRKFPLSRMFEVDRVTGEVMHRSSKAGQMIDPTIGLYEECAISHEHTVAKYCALLGTTLPGVISYEDRVAVNYLVGRRDVCNGRIGCVGLSGGGFRAALLQATCNRIQAAVVVGAMSTDAELLDHNVISHTWMFYPSGWPRYGDWSDLAACRAPSPLLVQYDRHDPLFTLQGMKEADRRLAAHYRAMKAATNYRGESYDGPHKFDVPMQISAFSWLKENLSA